MTELEMKKLSRADLLEMLIEQSKEMEEVKKQLAKAENELAKREIAIEESGSIAEASLKLNEVFGAAQAAADQYLNNIKQRCEKQEEVCKALEAETKAACEAMKAEAQIASAEMVAKAKAESKAYWEDVSAKLETFYNEHMGLRDMLAIISGKKE